MNKRYFLFFVLPLLILPGLANAQDLTDKDAEEIKYKAVGLVNEFKELLNAVGNPDIDSKTMKDIITNSYSAPANRIFFNDAVIIEDDIEPSNNVTKKRDMSVEKYLSSFDLFYTKSIDPTVSFTNLTTSNVRNKEYLYVKVYFESLFKGKSKKSEVPYAAAKRMAVVRAERAGKKWKTQIMGIGFQTGNDPDSQLDVPLQKGNSDVNTTVADASNNSQTLDEAGKQAALEEYKQKLIEQANVELEQKTKDYESAIQKGGEALAKKDYRTARSEYAIASKLFPYRPDPIRKLNEIDQFIEEKNPKTLEEKGKLAQQVRDYSAAIDFYNQVLEISPDRHELVNEIKKLNQSIEEVSFPKNKYDNGDFEGAQKEASRKIKQFKDKYPELYLIRGNCYRRAAKDKDALEDFDKAITIDRNYLEARIARAELYEAKKNYASAITDYDVITGSIAPTEAKYHSKKAALKSLANNLKGAIADYEKAVNVEKNKADYYEKGLLHYRLEEYDKAKQSFDNAISLDPNYPDAYFQRGRAFNQLHNVPEAAHDFYKAKKGGLNEQSQKVINDISSIYYAASLDAFKKGKFEEAIAQVSNVLLIRPDYPEAWFHKAESNFELKDYPSAKENYSKAVEYNKDYAEAYCRWGLAKFNLAEYESALSDFQKAASLKPTYFDALLGKGSTQMQLKHFQEAIPDFQAAIPLISQNQKAADANPATKKTNELKLADAYNKLGRSQYEVRNYTNAVENFRNALKSNKTFTDALLNRGLAYSELNEQKSAIEDFTAAIALESKRVDLYYARANAYERYEKYENAVNDYTVVIASEASASFKDALYRRGVNYSKFKMYPSALKDYEGYASANSLAVDSKFYAEVGFILLNLKQPDKAIENFNMAYDLDNKNSLAMYGLGFGYAQQNSLDKAIEWLEKGLLANKGQWEGLKQDEYLASIKGEKPFKNLKNKYKVK